MIFADSLVDQVRHVAGSTVQGLQNVAFAGSLLLSALLVLGVWLYARRRPKDAPLSWGQAMVAALYVTFGMVWWFGVVPDRWLNYAQGTLAMRSDAILAGPGSTGWLTNFPVVISKGAVADNVTILIYVVGVVVSVWMWAVWQGRGEKASEEIEKSNYGRPLVKASR